MMKGTTMRERWSIRCVIRSFNSVQFRLFVRFVVAHHLFRAPVFYMHLPVCIQQAHGASAGGLQHTGFSIFKYFRRYKRETKTKKQSQGASQLFDTGVLWPHHVRGKLFCRCCFCYLVGMYSCGIATPYIPDVSRYTLFRYV